MPLDWIDSHDARQLVSTMGSRVGLFFVEDATRAMDDRGRKVIPATDRPAFGNATFRIPVDLRGKKWVRFAAWDSAVNGAFTQPVHLVRR